ncbi:hypothetical protein GCM10009075_41810 [Sphingomonas trueperi]
MNGTPSGSGAGVPLGTGNGVGVSAVPVGCWALEPGDEQAVANNIGISNSERGMGNPLRRWFGRERSRFYSALQRLSFAKRCKVRGAPLLRRT